MLTHESFKNKFRIAIGIAADDVRNYSIEPTRSSLIESRKLNSFKLEDFDSKILDPTLLLFNNSGLQIDPEGKNFWMISVI
jgi:hypothetical protein